MRFDDYLVHGWDGVLPGPSDRWGYRRPMGTGRADAVIVGAGLAGSAAARVLAGRGRTVVLVEAFEPGHRRGSSHGSARIFRRAYPDPFYVRLTGQAQVLWRQLADEAGEELVSTTGALDYGPALPETMREIMTGFGVPAELMKAEAAAERWPGMSFGRDPVLYHPDGGVIDPERAMAVMRGIAAACGAQICYGSPVLRVEADDAGATVHTADRSWRAPVVIVAAGAWLEPLLGGQVPLPPLAVTQVQAFHFAPRHPGPWPVFICHDEVAMYGLPAGRDGEVPDAVKIGEHGRGTVTTGDGRDGIVSPAARDRVPRVRRPAARRPGSGARWRGDLPVHLDSQRGLHPGPLRAVRRLLALLGPRRQVRAARRRDRRRPSLRRRLARPPLHPRRPRRLAVPSACPVARAGPALISRWILGVAASLLAGARRRL